MANDQETIRVNALMKSLAELGGKGLKEEDIVYEGTKLSLPERFKGDLGGAIDFLKKKKKELDEPSNFSRTFNYRPWDGAYNAFQAMKKHFGMVMGKTTWSFFGPNPPQYIQVPISATETAEVPWGLFLVPMLEDTQFSFGLQDHKEYGPLFTMTINSPRKNHFMIDGIFKLVEAELKANSIYKGKPIDGQIQPQFLDLTGFNQAKVVYSEQVLADLEANLWSVLRYSEANRKLGLPLKRSILLEGPYGTGKSLAGFRTALEAVEKGWTFIMARPGRDKFSEVMQTARLYQPAVVFMEDVDTIAAAENKDYISELLDLFDGIQAKNTDLVVVLTTNHPELLHKGMMRPGRLDAIVSIGALDSAGIERLVRNAIGDDKLADNIQFDRVVAAADGYVPAFIKEMADRAVRYALARNAGDIGDYKITEDDLVLSANGLRSQFDRMQDAKEFTEEETLATSLRNLIHDATQKGVAKLAAKGDDLENAYPWDVEEVGKVQKASGASR